MIDILLRFWDSRVEDAFWASPAMKDGLLSIDQLAPSLIFINDTAGVLWYACPALHHAKAIASEQLILRNDCYYAAELHIGGKSSATVIGTFAALDMQGWVACASQVQPRE